MPTRGVLRETIEEYLYFKYFKTRSLLTAMLGCIITMCTAGAAQLIILKIILKNIKN